MFFDGMGWRKLGLGWSVLVWVWSRVGLVWKMVEDTGTKFHTDDETVSTPIGIKCVRLDSLTA